jgi:protease I
MRGGYPAHGDPRPFGEPLAGYPTGATSVDHDIEPASTFTADKAAKDADPDDYDALLLPDGTVNADRLRMDPDVRSFVQAVFRAGKPVGVICHGPWTLVSADLVQGRTLTSLPPVRPARAAR